tara:strand:+ start:174 stop:527 length:354 start_codon:yes stop_codon:yes gene_type:complete
MKKLLGIVVLGLLLNGCSQNQKAQFRCINKDGKEREYILSINLKDKIIMRAGVPYKINEVDETHIVGLNKNKEYENKIIFNRHTGELYFRSLKLNGSEAETLNDTASYTCIKSEKLI